MCEALRLCDDSIAFVEGGVWRATPQGGELFHQPRRAAGSSPLASKITGATATSGAGALGKCATNQLTRTVIVNPSGGRRAAWRRRDTQPGRPGSRSAPSAAGSSTARLPRTRSLGTPRSP